MMQLNTVRKINEACKAGKVSLAWKNGVPTGSTVYHARTLKGVLQGRLKRGDTGEGYWVNLSSYLVYQEEN